MVQSENIPNFKIKRFEIKTFQTLLKNISESP